MGIRKRPQCRPNDGPNIHYQAQETAARMGNDMKPAAELLIPCSETATAIRESSEPTRNENPPNNPQPYHDLGERQR